MSVLRATLRVRDELARAHPAAAPGHPRAVPALLAHLHPQQHRAPPHRARAPPPSHPAHNARSAPQPHAVNPQHSRLVLFSTKLPLLVMLAGGSSNLPLLYSIFLNFEFIIGVNWSTLVRSNKISESPRVEPRRVNRDRLPRWCIFM